MKNKNVTKTIKKGRKKVGLIITLGIIVVLGIGGFFGMTPVMKEHKEIRALPLNLVDFNDLRDGVYTGEFAGGMYKWRENSVKVTVSGGKVTDITFLSESMPYKDTDKRDDLYGRVIKEQSLQVDVISGATLTSKGYLQAIENALLQADS